MGATLGALCGRAVLLRTDDDGAVLSRAGLAAILLWCAGMGSRFAFAFWASHGGEDALGRFSVEHAITSAQAWTTALVLMAVAQVVAKLGVQLLRARRLQGAATRPVLAAN